MKNIILVFIFSVLQLTSMGKSLEAYFSYCTFYSPENGPYMETYLSISGQSIKYVQNENGKFNGSVEVTYLFKQDGEIKSFQKHNLLSPEIDDTLQGAINFLDQQRIQLANGEYDLEIILSDQNTNNKPFTANQSVQLNYSNSQVQFSEIELLETYEKASQPGMLTKSGYDLVPYVTDYFPISMEKLSFYVEIYNTAYAMGEEEKYLVNYYLETFGSKRPLSNFRGFARKDASKVNVVLSQFNIQELPSGDYHLVLEVRNRENEMIKQKKIFFHRENPAMAIDPNDLTEEQVQASFVQAFESRDTLAEYIQSIRPKANEAEMRFIDNNLKTTKIEEMQSFFLSFWLNRSASEPELAWVTYKHEVAKVNEFYSTTIKKGYNTDRGRIYLKYGPPNTLIERKNDPGSYPYEIWHYYKIEVRSDARFIFYDNDLVTNDYRLLHSNVRGEVNDYRWQARLQERSGLPSNIDNGGVQDQYGNPVDDLFTNPR